MSGDFTSGLRVAVDDARAIHHAFLNDEADLDQLCHVLARFEDIMGEAHDHLGLPDDHGTSPELVTVDRAKSQADQFEDLLTDVVETGRILEGMSDDDPVEEFQYTSDRYLTLLDTIANWPDHIVQEAALAVDHMTSEVRFDLALQSLSEVLQDTGRELTAYTSHERMNDGLPSAVELAQIRARLQELNAHVVDFAEQIDQAERQVVGDMASEIADEIPWAERVSLSKSATANLFDPFEDVEPSSWDR